MLAQKSFISLAFTDKKLQILELNPQKNGVKKYCEIALPDGIINNYKVANKTSLTQILKEAWMRLKLEEKSVGIIIPEFSTFSKTLILPILKTKELDEAIRWQAADFLPFSLDQMVMDWKITQKQDNNYQILAVAIPKDVLASFVNAVSESGLYPLVVETPALALSRISDDDKKGKLVIYINAEEAVIVLAQGEEIISSSVVNTSDQEGILSTAINMIKHYHEVKIEKLAIGGLKFTQGLINDLQKNTGLPVSWIQPDITGLTPEEIQTYLIPIALQFKDPAEPADETTINLASPEWMKIYQNNKLKNQLSTLLIFITIFVWGCLAAALTVFFILEKNILALQKTTIQAQNVPQDLINQINQINETSSKVITLSSAFTSPQLIVNAILKAKPSGISISSYKLDLDTGKIFLKGQASDRGSLIKFKQALEKNENFSKVIIPISALATEQNVEFEINFNWQKKANTMTIPIK